MIDRATLWAFMKEFIYANIKGIIMKYGAYEPNNRQTWEGIWARANEFTEKLVPLGYLEECKVVCDETTNNEETIKANEFHLDFHWRLTKESGETVTQFALTPTGLEATEVDVL